MREFKIKETCSCGAILEIYETKVESWESGEAKFRQEAFHKAHEKHREPIITGEPIKQKTKFPS